MQKRIIEVAAIRLNELGADIKILRLTNVYGGMNFLKNKSVIANFINAKRKNEDLVINGNGEQIRDFIHVSDVCDAIYKCIEYDIKIPKPIDIGTGIGTSIYELAKMTKNKFVFDEYSKMVGVLKNIAEVKKAEEIIGFKTTRKIQDYMKEG
jgi:UDP-glucose 4-epimerase